MDEGGSVLNVQTEFSSLWLWKKVIERETKGRVTITTRWLRLIVVMAHVCTWIPVHHSFVTSSKAAFFHQQLQLQKENLILPIEAQRVYYVSVCSTSAIKRDEPTFFPCLSEIDELYIGLGLLGNRLNDVIQFVY